MLDDTYSPRLSWTAHGSRRRVECGIDWPHADSSPPAGRHCAVDRRAQGVRQRHWLASPRHGRQEIEHQGGGLRPLGPVSSDRAERRHVASTRSWPCVRVHASLDPRRRLRWLGPPRPSVFSATPHSDWSDARRGNGGYDGWSCLVSVLATHATTHSSFLKQVKTGARIPLNLGLITSGTLETRPCDVVVVSSSNWSLRWSLLPCFSVEQTECFQFKWFQLHFGTLLGADYLRTTQHWSQGFPPDQRSFHSDSGL